MPEVDFDDVIDRCAVPALKHHRIVPGEDGMDLIPAGVADKDFHGLGLAPGDLTAFLRQEARRTITRGIAFGPQGAGLGGLNTACPRARLSEALDRLNRATRRVP